MDGLNLMNGLMDGWWIDRIRMVPVYVFKYLNIYIFLSQCN